MDKNKILKITHNAGFFSCCTQRLRRIIDFYNENKICPLVDSSEQFLFYKTNPNIDITDIFFDGVFDSNIEFSDKVFFTKLENKIDHHSDQFTDYHLLNFDKINPFVEKYFKISSVIERKYIYFNKKYNLNYDNLCAVFYRGNDKHTETIIGGYDEYIKKAKEIKLKNSDTEFLVQTDDELFLKAFLLEYPNSIYFDELPRIHDKNTTVHYKLPIHNRTNAAIDFLCVTYIISKCNKIITHSGNCGLWSVLFKGNSEGIIQYLKNNEDDINVWYEQ
jgi:hypothetical protein